MTVNASSIHKTASACLIWCVIGMLCVQPIHVASAQQACLCESPSNTTSAANAEVNKVADCCSGTAIPKVIACPTQKCSCQRNEGECQCVDCHCADDQETPTPQPGVPCQSENISLSWVSPNSCQGLILNLERSLSNGNTSLVAANVLSAQQTCVLLSRFSC